MITNCHETFEWKEIVVTPTEIYIDIKDDDFDKRRNIIQHYTCKWTTLFVEIADRDGQKSKGHYIIDNDFHLTGTFDVETIEDGYLGFSVGIRDGGRCFTGEIASLELGYSKNSKYFSDCMKSLIMTDQMVE